MAKKLFKSNKIYVGPSEVQGYGVFCSEDLRKGEVLEECYYLTPENSKWQDLDKVFLRYFFSVPYLQQGAGEFCDENGGVTIQHITRPICVLGYGMIYNHDKKNNVDWQVFEVSNTVKYTANQNIKAGTELLIKYNDYIDFKNA